MSKVSPDVIGTCLNNMDKVEFVPHIWGTGLTFDQVDALFTEMKTKTKLRILNIRSNDLSRVPAKVMAECVNKIEEVDMWNTPSKQGPNPDVEDPDIVPPLPINSAAEREVPLDPSWVKTEMQG